MWWRLSLSILLIILVGVFTKSLLYNDVDHWECRTHNNKELKFTISDRLLIRSYLGHHIKKGSGVIIQCKRYHGVSSIYDSSWHEILTIYTNLPQKIEVDLNNKNSILRYSAVKKDKHLCFSFAKKGRIKFSKKKLLFNDVNLIFSSLSLIPERRHCMKKVLENDEGIYWE